MPQVWRNCPDRAVSRPVHILEQRGQLLTPFVKQKNFLPLIKPSHMTGSDKDSSYAMWSPMALPGVLRESPGQITSHGGFGLKQYQPRNPLIQCTKSPREQKTHEQLMAEFKIDESKASTNSVGGFKSYRSDMMMEFIRVSPMVKSFFQQQSQ